ncbi:MAG TPA: F0F1 ATP synthase subunit epsilon [Candidatus Paceibacterota bacterium]|nr:F0F1 ATP synthase subunit epsilon [Candidatus Paceibacterota bacterium]
MAGHNTFHLTIASVGATTFDGPAVSATMPGAAGEFTVLAHHEPLVSILKKGTITVRKEGSEAMQFPIESGVVEMSGNKATVLL